LTGIKPVIRQLTGNKGLFPGRRPQREKLARAGTVPLSNHYTEGSVP
jgi:hypothetical protein